MQYNGCQGKNFRVRIDSPFHIASIFAGAEAPVPVWHPCLEARYLEASKQGPEPGGRH